MTPPAPFPRRLVLILVALVPFAAGCRRETASKSDSQSAPLSGFVAQTKGTPEALWDHLKRLNRRFAETKQADLDTARKDMLDYSSAVEATANAILAHREASPELRRMTGEAKLDVMLNRMEVDHSTFERIMAATDQLEAEPKTTALAPIADYYRVLALRESLQPSYSKEKVDRKRLDRLFDAVVRLGRATPAHPEAPAILLDMAELGERIGDDKLAARMYGVLAERFPDHEFAKYAAGTLFRESLKGRVVDDFRGPAPDGKTVDLKDLRGKVVLIDFWATWCVPCVEETPGLKALRDKFGPMGFEILGVTLDDSAEDLRAFLDEQHLPWPQIFTPSPPESPADSPLALKYGVAKVPFKMLIDRQGKLIASGYFLEHLMPTLEAQLDAPKPTSGD